jgi:hypothetical protein
MRFLCSLLLLSSLTQGQCFGKTIPIPVDSIFNHIKSLSEIKVIGYVGDTLMNYIDIESQDTLQLDCKWKKYSEAETRIMKDRDTTYQSLEGTFPEVGETLFILFYEYGRNGCLFARKEMHHFRFWDPNSIPFANSVFFVAKEGIYKPTEWCKTEYQTQTEFYCSDGFVMAASEFEKIIALY